VTERRRHAYASAMILARFPVAAAAALSLAACGESPTAADIVGAWGGEHVALTIAATGAALEFDCAHGSIEERIVPDADGGFDVAGIYVREHGGPVREGEPPDSHPARYTGRIDGSRMTLTVLLTDDPAFAASYTLRRGEPPQVYRCV
jgi:hypothetical protein